jgi:quinone-modifying oxidoreductase subunit QmoB
MDTRVGVYICGGCEIKDLLAIDKLAELASGECGAATCKTHDTLCSSKGLEIIGSDVKNEDLNRISVVACSGRMFPELFDFGDNVLVDRANIREQVAWCQAPNDEDAQMLAEDVVRLSVARLKNSKPPEPFLEETSKDILVVGGGMTGLTAARAAADTGYRVILIEKEDKLGGWAQRFSRVFPKNPPYRDLEDPGHTKLIEDVENSKLITVYKSTTIEKTEGQPGMFSVSLTNGDKSNKIAVGSIVLATGWRPYEAEKLTHLGYDSSPNIITNIQMEDMAARGEIKRPSDGKGVDSVVLIQCAGSRDQDHLAYCSGVCCRVSLKQAMYIREKYPDARIHVIYKDVRSPAQFEMFYAAVQDDEGFFFTKGEIAGVSTNGDGRIDVIVEETLLGEDIRIRADLVVLATGMVPTTKVESDDDDPGETAIEPAEKIEETEQQEDETGDAKKAAECAEPGAKILNLTYRQGTDLPTIKYGFPDSHFICFPYETRRTGIYAAGAVRAPMDLASGINDARGAVLKAIQAVEAISRGVALHPRAGDSSYPDFFMQRCTQCKRCTEECPFGSLDEDAKGTPLPNPLRCRRCGICLGACPERIVNFDNYNVNMISQMIKSVHIPDEFEEKPRILAFVCENDAVPAIDMVGVKRLKYNAMLRIIPLRCLGSMNSVWVGDALARGFDGVLLIGCKKGDDYQCHFIHGSELANTRMENVREKLKQLVLEEERVEIHELSMSDYGRIPKIFDDFLEVIETVGPNPFKGM